MTLPYAVAALGLVTAALLALALATIGLGGWLRWLQGRGPVLAVAALVVTGGAALNTLVPRGCDETGVPGTQRPLTAALGSTGDCHRDGLSQLALVPLAGVASSLVASRTGRSPGQAPGAGGLASPRRPTPPSGDEASGPPSPARVASEVRGVDVTPARTARFGTSPTATAAGGEPAAPRLGHRAELDGVRGLAVLAVLLGHAGLPGVPKIHIYGVGLFFVLSGLLITVLLLEERVTTGSVRLRSFYLRRLRRLGPALAAFLVLVSLATVALGAFGRDEVRTGVAAVVLLVADEAKVAGRDMGPIGHLWSLSVEAHFYLVWPVLFVLACRFAPRRALRWVGLLAGAGLLGSIALTLWHLDQLDFLRAENSTGSRASGLLAGSLLALAFHARRTGRPLLGAPLGALVGAASLLALVALSTDRWFGPRGELPVELAAVVLLGALLLAPSRLNQALRWPPLVRLGTLSYAVYLWHYPVFLLVGGELRTMSPFEALTASVLTLGIAELSMALVERPFLSRPADGDRTCPGAATPRERRGPRTEPTGAPRLLGVEQAQG